MAEWAEPGVAIHLPLEDLSRLTLPSTALSSMKGGVAADSVIVALESVGEGPEIRLVVGFDGGDPGIEAVAVTAGEHFSERADALGCPAQPRPSIGSRWRAARRRPWPTAVGPCWGGAAGEDATFGPAAMSAASASGSPANHWAQLPRAAWMPGMQRLCVAPLYSSS